MSEILSLLWERRSLFFELFMQHIMICGVSIILACLLGVTLGINAAQQKRTSGFVIGSANFVYTIPSISMLGFLIPVTGIGNTTAIVALTIYGLLPMVRATYTGLKNIDPLLIEAAKGMGSTKRQVLWKIKIPLAMPVIISGLRNMVVMTIALAGIASFVGAGGLGVAIYRGITLNNTAMTVAGSLLIAVLALIADAAVGFAGKIFAPEAKYKHSKIIGLAVLILILAATAVTPMVLSASHDSIKIATKPMTEQYIIGQILKQKIESEIDMQVNLTQGVGGGTANIHPALKKGDFDIYPEYTGTGWSAILGNKSTYSESNFVQLNQQYADNFQLEWVGSYGFQNTYGMAVQNSLAKEYNLKSISDLVPIADKFTLGAEPDFFERADGYPGLRKAYGLKFGKTKDIDVGLKYEAIRGGQIQVIPIFTTDGQLANSNLTVLKDDRGFYPAYNCMNVVRQEVLKKYPQLRQVLLELEGTIDEQKMSAMNALVDSNKFTPHEVAKQFLNDLKKNKGK